MADHSAFCPRRSSPDLRPRVAATLERLDELVQRFDQHPDPAVQERVVELLQCMDGLHREGLRRLSELLKREGLEQQPLGAPEVRLLFELYDLTGGGERTRAEAVLETVQPSIHSYGARSSSSRRRAAS